MMALSEEQRQRVLANSEKWIQQFQGNVSFFTPNPRDTTQLRMVHDVLMTITKDMLQRFDREPRRWIQRDLKTVLESRFPEWTELYNESVPDLVDFIDDYVDFLEDQHHLNNADALNATMDQLSFDHFEDDLYPDDTYANEYDAQDIGGQMNQIIAMIAAARRIDVPVGEDETVQFMNEHAAEMVMLAEHLTLQEAVSISMPPDEDNPQKFAHEFYTNFILPDIDIKRLLSDMGASLASKAETNQGVASDDVILMMVEQSLLGDDTPLNQNQRTMLASRMDGDPLTNPGAERRFIERHQAVMQQYFGAPATAVTPHNKPGKIIDFAAAKKKHENPTKY